MWKSVFKSKYDYRVSSWQENGYCLSEQEEIAEQILKFLQVLLAYPNTGILVYPSYREINPSLAYILLFNAFVELSEAFNLAVLEVLKRKACDLAQGDVGFTLNIFLFSLIERADEHVKDLLIPLSELEKYIVLVENGSTLLITVRKFEEKIPSYTACSSALEQAFEIIFNDKNFYFEKLVIDLSIYPGLQLYGKGKTSPVIRRVISKFTKEVIKNKTLFRCSSNPKIIDRHIA